MESVMKFLSYRQFPRYQRVESLDDEARKTNSLVEAVWDIRGNAPSSAISWMVSTFCLLLALLIVSWKYVMLLRSDSFQNGFATDFAPLKHLIETKKVVFGGTLRYTDSGHLYMDNGPENAEYFGPPSPEIDQAWKNLIENEYLIEISEEEVAMIEGKTNAHPIVGYRMIPDFVHSLHCVNHMRMILDSEYYFNASLTNLRRIDRIHIHHCLNHIRQLIQCNVDLTPVTSVYMPSVNTFVGNFEQAHTCRDMTRVQKWIAERRRSEIGVNNPNRHIDLSMYPNHEAPGQGYDLNNDALMPWDWTQSEYE